MNIKILFISIVIIFLFANDTYSQHWGKLGNGLKVTFEPKDLFGDTVTNKLYAVGVFPVPGFFSQRVLYWDGTQWDSLGHFDSTLVGIPQAINRYDNNLYLFGTFPTISNIPARNIGYWDGSTWNALPQGPNDGGYALTVINNELYIGGPFDSVGNIRSPAIAKWDGAQWHSLATGIVDPYGATVYTIAEYHGWIYAGGTFEDSLDQGAVNLERFNGTNWEQIPGWAISNFSFIQALAVYHDELYVGGYFLKSDGSLGDHIVKWNDTVWSEVGGGADYSIRELMVYHDELYACGDFSHVGGIPASHIAKWDGTKWCNLGNDYFQYGIFDMTVWNDTLYISGGFKTINADTFNYVAKWLGGDYTDSCSTPTGISEIKQSNFAFSLSPNPATTSLTITYNIEHNATLTITNAYGSIVKQLTLYPYFKNRIVYVDDLAEGIYLVQLNEGSSSASMKFVKE